MSTMRNVGLGLAALTVLAGCSRPSTNPTDFEATLSLSKEPAKVAAAHNGLPADQKSRFNPDISVPLHLQEHADKLAITPICEGRRMIINNDGSTETGHCDELFYEIRKGDKTILAVVKNPYDEPGTGHSEVTDTLAKMTKMNSSSNSNRATFDDPTETRTSRWNQFNIEGSVETKYNRDLSQKQATGDFKVQYALDFKPGMEGYKTHPMFSGAKSDDMTPVFRINDANIQSKELKK